MGAADDSRVGRGLNSGRIVKLDLEPAMAERFEQYLSLLLKWNARTNLTSVREPQQIVQRHFAESIFAAQQVPPEVKTLLDFGSGAGFPGIPIAIYRPKITVTLAESQGKKAAFLREAVRTLGLKAEVWAGRVEAMPKERVFDAVTSRAVDRMPAACRMAVERLADGGWIGVFATRATEEALRAVAGVRWSDAVAIPGAEQAVLLQGTVPD